MAIEIVELPIDSMVIFQSFLYVYQRIYPNKIPLNHYKIPVNHYKSLSISMKSYYKVPLNHYKIPLNHYNVASCRAR